VFHVTQNIEVVRHHIREALANLVHLARISTALQVVDIFTKAMKTETQVSYCQNLLLVGKHSQFEGRRGILGVFMKLMAVRVLIFIT